MAKQARVRPRWSKFTRRQHLHNVRREKAFVHAVRKNPKAERFQYYKLPTEG